MKFSRFVFNTAAAGFFCALTFTTQAQNLISNGSFEDNSGSFNHWNTANNSGFLTVDDGSSTLFSPADGSYYALLAGSGDAINQSIATTPNGNYRVDFLVNDKYGGSDLAVHWGTSTLLHLDTTYSSAASGQFNNGWVEFQFVVPATSSSADLSFTSSTGTVGVDAVSVATVPEPSVLGAASGLCALACCFRRRNCKPQD